MLTVNLVLATLGAPKVNITLSCNKLDGWSKALRIDTSSEGYYGGTWMFDPNKNATLAYDQWGLDGKSGRPFVGASCTEADHYSGSPVRLGISVWALSFNATILGDTLAMDHWVHFSVEDDKGWYTGGRLLFSKGDCKAVTCLNGDCSRNSTDKFWSVCYNGPVYDHVEPAVPVIAAKKPTVGAPADI